MWGRNHIEFNKQAVEMAIEKDEKTAMKLDKQSKQRFQGLKKKTRKKAN